MTPSTTSHDHVPDIALWAALARRQSGRRRLLIIARDRHAFYEHARREFAGRADIEVILDRRVGDRRARKGLRAFDRRSGDRRKRPEIDALIRATGYAVVHL